MRTEQLRRNVTAIASGVLAYVESKQQGGLRDPAGAPRPINVGVTVKEPTLATTIKSPRVTVATEPLVAGLAIAATVGILVWLVLRKR